MKVVKIVKKRISEVVRDWTRSFLIRLVFCDRTRFLKIYHQA